MRISVDVPDTLAARLGITGQALSDAAVQALALEAYRTGRLAGIELRELLGMPTRAALDQWLEERGVPRDYSIDEWRQEREVLGRLTAGHVDEPEA